MSPFVVYGSTLRVSLGGGACGHVRSKQLLTTWQGRVPCLWSVNGTSKVVWPLVLLVGPLFSGTPTGLVIGRLSPFLVTHGTTTRRARRRVCRHTDVHMLPSLSLCSRIIAVAHEKLSAARPVTPEAGVEYRWKYVVPAEVVGATLVRYEHPPLLLHPQETIKR